MSNVFIQIHVTHTLDLVTCINDDGFTNHKLLENKHQENAAWRKICEEFNSHMKSNNILN